MNGWAPDGLQCGLNRLLQDYSRVLIMFLSHDDNAFRRSAPALEFVLEVVVYYVTLTMTTSV